MMNRRARDYRLVRRACVAATGLLLLSPPAATTAQESARQATATARRGDHVDVYHGVEVPDPYRWMEDMDDPETLAWVRAQDERARAFAAAYDRRDAIRRRIQRVARVRRLGTPLKRGGAYFYLEFGAAGPGPGTSLHMRTGPDGPARTVIDDARLAADGEALVRMAPGPDGRRVAYGTVQAGSRWMTVRVRDLETGRDLPDRLVGIHRGGSALSWAPDGSGFYYERFDLPPQGQRRRARLTGERVVFHLLGEPQERDQVIYRPEDDGDGVALTHRVSDDGRYLVITVSPADARGVRVRVLDLQTGEAHALVDRPDASFRFVGNDGPQLWFQTDLDAPRGRVVAIDLRRPDRADWVELIPQRDEAIDSWVGAAAIGGRIVVGYVEDAHIAVRVYDTDGRFGYRLKLPRLGSIWSGFVGRQDDPEAFYSLSGVADPGTIYRLDLESGRSTRFLRPELEYDPGDIVTEQVFFTSADGARVPMYLAYRRGLDFEARPPVYMYGYGFGAWTAQPWFQAHIAVWLQMGGVWALPNIRGGGAYGEDWHQAGSRRRKQQAIDDYIAAGEWLVRNGYTRRQRLVANASSAGGAIAGAAIAQRPDLYGAAVLDFPVLDMLRYAEFTGARRWIPEYGAPDDPADFQALHAYSPYHNLEAGTCYPATFVAPGERDETTPPLHAYKFVAALQHAQSCDRPILLRVAWGAGHTYGADLDRSIDGWADRLAFLARALARDGWSPRLEGTASLYR